MVFIHPWNWPVVLQLKNTISAPTFSILSPTSSYYERYLPHLNSDSTLFFLKLRDFPRGAQIYNPFLKFYTKSSKNYRRVAIHQLSSEKKFYNIVDFKSAISPSSRLWFGLFFFWILVRNSDMLFFFCKYYTKCLRSDLQTRRPKKNPAKKWKKDNSSCLAQESALWRS